MKRAPVFLLAAMLLVTAGTAHGQTPGSPPDSATLEARTREIASQLRCVVCQGLSIQDSPSPLAQDMRRAVRDQLAEGRTPEEVKASFVAAYGEWVLLQPAARGFNLAVYVLPVLALLGGIAAIAVMTRRWSRSAPAEDPPGIASDDPDLAPWDELAKR